MGQLRIWKLCCIVRNKCITAQQGFIAGHAEVAIRPSLICQVSRDIKQISLSNIYPFDIHKIKHMSWFENETKQYQMLLLCINSWSNYCLKAAVLSPQSVWLLEKKKRKKSTHNGGSVAKEAYLLLYLWGNIETVRGEKWNPVPRSEHDLRKECTLSPYCLCSA